jgi:hypothetical protein
MKKITTGNLRPSLLCYTEPSPALPRIDVRLPGKMSDTERLKLTDRLATEIKKECAPFARPVLRVWNDSSTPNLNVECHDMAHKGSRREDAAKSLATSIVLRVLETWEKSHG